MRLPAARLILPVALVLVGAADTHAQTVESGRAPTATGPHAASALKPRHPLAVVSWFSLGASNGMKFDTRIGSAAQQEITVFARHRDRDRDWVGDIDVSRPMYEAVNSEAAQQIYARPNDWASPEQQRLASVVKDWLELCGTLGFTCPNPTAR